MFFEFFVSNTIVAEMIDKMKCNILRKKLLAYSDGELSPRQSTAIRNHLNHCPDCKKQFEMLSNIFNSADGFKRTVTPHSLWTKLSSKIEEYESRRNHFSAFWEIMQRYAVSLGILVIFGIGIFAGIFLGSFPDSKSSDAAGMEPALSARAQFIQSSFLETFNDLPPRSIGGIYKALALENNERDIR